LNIDTSNSRIGIGTTTPRSKLEVRGSTSDNTASGLNITNSDGSSLLYVRNDGNVGIGTTSPSSVLQVQAGGTDTTTSALNITDSVGSSLLYIRDDGNVGIGTTTPSKILHTQKSGDAQLRLSADATYYVDLAVDAAGHLELTQTGTKVFLKDSSLKVCSGACADPSWTGNTGHIQYTGELWHNQTRGIPSGDIQDGAVIEAKIGSGAVTTAKIAANAVTGSELSTNSVQNNHVSATANIAKSKISTEGNWSTEWSFVTNSKYVDYNAPVYCNCPAGTLIIGAMTGWNHQCTNGVNFPTSEGWGYINEVLHIRGGVDFQNGISDVRWKMVQLAPGMLCCNAACMRVH
jgi:hypothetical protein